MIRPPYAAQEHTMAYGRFGEKLLGSTRRDEVSTTTTPGSAPILLAHTAHRRSRGDFTRGLTGYFFIRLASNGLRQSRITSGLVMPGSSHRA